MIKEIWEEYLPIVSAKKTADQLGDRSDYIGASDDPAKACIRKLIASKKLNANHGVRQLGVFGRGHAIEEGLVLPVLQAWETFAEKKKGLRRLATQFEVTALDGGLKGHIDFLLADETGSITVVECKTSSGVSSPYDSWNRQVNLQLGMLLDIPKFASKNVSGEIFVFDVKTGEYNEFPVKFNKNLYNFQVARAREILDILKTDVDPLTLPTTRSSLCGDCSFNCDCPAYAVCEYSLPPEYKEAIEYITHSQKLVDEIQKQIDEKTALLKGYGPFKTVFNGIKASVVIQKRTSPDMAAFKAAYPKINNILNRFNRETTITRFSSSFLTKEE